MLVLLVLSILFIIIIISNKQAQLMFMLKKEASDEKFMEWSSRPIFAIFRTILVKYIRV